MSGISGVWDRFLTIWARDSCAFCLYDDQWVRLLRDSTFVLQMALSWPDVDSLGLLPSDACFIWCFVSTSKSPSSNSAYKIPCKNYLRWDFDDYSYQQLGFSIKKSCWRSNPKSPGLLFWVFYTLEESSLQQLHIGIDVNEEPSWVYGKVHTNTLVFDLEINV